MPGQHNFNGVWRSTYGFISHSRGGIECESEYFVTIHQKGGQLIVESLPNKEESYLLLRLTLDGRVATGTWSEQTSPEGYYEGATYYGALQLILSEDGKKLEGKWLGFDRNLQVNSGPWEIVRIGQKIPEGEPATQVKVKED